MVTFWPFATGLTVFNAATTTENYTLSPHAALPIKETVLAPMLAQVKDVCPAVREIIAQLSVELLLISAAVIEAAPLASR